MLAYAEMGGEKVRAVFTTDVQLPCDEVDKAGITECYQVAQRMSAFASEEAL